MGRKARQHWYALYLIIKPRVDSFSGEESVHEFIRDEADAAGYEEKVIKRMLAAGRFLESIVSDPISENAVKCGYAHIEILSRINRLDAERARALLAPVLANQVTIQELNKELASCSDVPGGAQLTARARARQRIIGHRNLAFELAQRMDPDFFGAPEAEMVLVRSSGTFGRFILLNDPHKPIAILPRLGDSSQREEKAAADLIKLALAHRPYFHRVWLVLPGASLLARKVVAQAYELGALGTWLHLAVPNEDASALIPYDDLGQLLIDQMEGESRFYWKGVSLADGGPREGWLDPRND